MMRVVSKDVLQEAIHILDGRTYFNAPRVMWLAGSPIAPWPCSAVIRVDAGETEVNK